MLTRTGRIGVMAAMPEELQALLDLMPDETAQHRAGRAFWIGHLHGREVVAVLSRIGKVAAATTTTVLIEHFGVRQIVFTGVAGGLGDGVRVGDVVVASHCLQHDMNASPLFPRYEVPLYGQAHFACDPVLAEGLRVAARAVQARVESHFDASVRRQYGLDAMQVHQGLLISGDRFVSAADEALGLRARLPEALAVEMEAAAVAQVCHDYGVRFAALRTISDRADDQAHVDFPAFLEAVAGRCTTLIVGGLLDHLSQQPS